MVLKPCKTCGKMVSENASKCPYCGEKNPTAIPFSQKSTAGKAVDVAAGGIATISVVICGIIIFIVLLCFL